MFAPEDGFANAGQGKSVDTGKHTYKVYIEVINWWQPRLVQSHGVNTCSVEPSIAMNGGNMAEAHVLYLEVKCTVAVNWISATAPADMLLMVAKVATLCDALPPPLATTRVFSK